MTKFLIILLAIALIICVGLLIRPSFISQKPSDYAQNLPQFDITKNLGGVMKSEGVLYGPTGKVALSFVATMVGEWSGNVGTLKENFTYSNGTEQNREWTITLHDNGRIAVTAPDVIGEGDGVISGNTLMIKYKLQLTKEAGGHVLDVVDWLYLMENGVVINKSEMRKYGVKVAELVANIRPEDM